jgi:hypothetical protein
MYKQQVDHKVLYCAGLLFVISITLLITGIALQLDEQERFKAPAVETIDSDENIISVTSVDDVVIFDDSKSQKEDSLNKVQDKTTDSSTLSTMEKVNDTLRKEIQDTYGISVFYGKETDGYRVITKELDLSAVSILDVNTIYDQLKKLKATLSLYPSDLFKEIRDGGIPLSVYLINYYTDKTVTGVTDSTYNYAHISIAAIYSFEDSFYHESYHYIERYLLKKGAKFNSWNSLNPSDFHYGIISNYLSYSHTFLADASFVNNYAQTSPEEDRASTFEYMMATNKASCLTEDNPVWRKAKYMALTIETILKSVKPNRVEYWERFI